MRLHRAGQPEPPGLKAGADRCRPRHPATPHLARRRLPPGRARTTSGATRPGRARARRRRHEATTALLTLGPCRTAILAAGVRHRPHVAACQAPRHHPAGRYPAERRPERGVVAVARHVEQPLGDRRSTGGTSRRASAPENSGRRRACARTPRARGAERVGEAQPVEHVRRAAVEGCEAGKSTSSRPSAASTSTAASPARSVLGLRATKAARFSGGARDPRERVGSTAGAHQGVVVERAEALQRRVGAAQHGPQVVVLPEERGTLGSSAPAPRRRRLATSAPVPRGRLALEERDPDAAPASPSAAVSPRSRPHDDDVPGAGGTVRPAATGSRSRWRWKTARRSRPGRHRGVRRPGTTTVTTRRRCARGRSASRRTSGAGRRRGRPTGAGHDGVHRVEVAHARVEVPVAARRSAWPRPAG